MDSDELFENTQKTSDIWENKFDILDDDISQIAEILADCSSSQIVTSLMNTANLSEDLYLKAKLYSLIGLIYFAKGQFDLAEQMYLAAVEINKKIPDKENLAANFDNLGIVYLIQGELEQALQMYKNALQIDGQIGNKENQAIGYGNLGLIYYEQCELGLAQDMFEQALDINLIIDCKEGIARDHYNLAMLYEKLADCQTARRHWDNAAKLFSQLGKTEITEKIHKKFLAEPTWDQDF